MCSWGYSSVVSLNIDELFEHFMVSFWTSSYWILSSKMVSAMLTYVALFTTYWLREIFTVWWHIKYLVVRGALYFPKREKASKHMYMNIYLYLYILFFHPEPKADIWTKAARRSKKCVWRLWMLVEGNSGGLSCKLFFLILF